MANKTYKVLLEKLGGTDATNYVGNEGELFYDPTTTTLRVGDGTTAGGSVVSGGGGSVDGNISISATNSEINFVANSSGDGFGYSTIELKPDTNTTSDQYLIIDPTQPGHIHIRAGGTQDESDAHLFLGGEETFFRVVDGSSGGARMQRTWNQSTFTAEYNSPADFTNGSWFVANGNSYIRYTTANLDLAEHIFELDNNRENYVTIYWADGGFSYTLRYGGSAEDEGEGVYKVQVDAAPDNNTPITFTSMYWDLHQARNNYAEVTGGDFTVDVRDDVRITGRDLFSLRNWSNVAPISIITRYDDLDYTWAFGADGVLSLPGSIEFTDNSVQTGAAISVVELKALVANCATYGEFQTAIAAL
jgi:hypothetical protein